METKILKPVDYKIKLRSLLPNKFFIDKVLSDDKQDFLIISTKRRVKIFGDVYCYVIIHQSDIEFGDYKKISELILSQFKKNLRSLSRKVDNSISEVLEDL